MHWVTEVAGFLASITGFLVWVPQARRVWRDRHDPVKLSGVAVQTQALSLAGNVLWGIYAIGIGSFWLGAPSVVNIPIAVMTILVVRRSQKAPDDASTLAALRPVEEPLHAVA